MIEMRLQLFGGRGGGSGMSGGGGRGASEAVSAGGSVMNKSPQEAMDGFFNKSGVVWAGYADVARAEAYNISEVYKDSYDVSPLSNQRSTGEVDDIYRAKAAEDSIEKIAKNIVANNVDRSNQLNRSGNPLRTDSNGYALESPNPLKTLGQSGYNELRKAIIDEARKYSNNNARARRDYKKYLG